MKGSLASEAHGVLGRLWVLAALLVLSALGPSAARADVPLLPPGAPLGDAAPASLLQPSALQATFRVPPIPGLSIVSTWLARGFTVTLTYPDGRHEVIAAAPSLPGEILGVRLPDDAYRATRIDLTGSIVSQEATPLLVTDDILARSLAGGRWDVVACGAFFALTLLAALLLTVRRRRALVALTVAAAANCLLALPFVGIVRPPPELSQPLHALAFALALAGVLGVLLDRTAAARPPRTVIVLALVVALASVVYVAGADVAQDLWLGGNIALLRALDHAFPLAFALATLALALAARRTPDGPLLIAATAAAAIASALGAASAFTPTETGAQIAHLTITAGPLAELLLLTALLATRTRAPERDERDELTGLASRVALTRAMDAAWRANEGAPLALLLVDLDHFRRYDATCGYAAGDDALRSCAAALTAACADVPGALVARADGDGFAVLAPVYDDGGAFALGQRMHDAIAALDIPHAQVPLGRLCASVGVASGVPDPTTSPDALTRRADAALFIAKAMGRNRVVLDEPVSADTGRPVTERR